MPHSILHPKFGRQVKNGATDTCSKCGHTIPDDHIPVTVRNINNEVMWVYCVDCEGPMSLHVYSS